MDSDDDLMQFILQDDDDSDDELPIFAERPGVGIYIYYYILK